MAKTAEIEKLLAQTQRNDRFTAAIKIVDNATGYTVRKSLADAVRGTFRGTGGTGAGVRAVDLLAIELLICAFHPSPPGKRSCSVYHSSLCIHQTGPDDVFQVLSEYPQLVVGGCGGQVEYLDKVRRRCAPTGRWHAQCATLLPLQQLKTLRDTSPNGSGLRYALGALLSDFKIYSD